MQHDTSSRADTASHHRTAIIIANPNAGSYQNNKDFIEETREYLARHDWQVEVKLTRSQGDAQTLAREAVERKLSAVIATGGDGTINEIIQALAGSETALGVLPSGTVNVWAREVGIPLELDAARDILISGVTRQMDLGQVNERYFLLMATIGLDAEITHAVEQNPIKRFGVLGYALLGTRLGIAYRNFTSFLQLGKRTEKMRTHQIIIGNTQLYAGALKYTWQAKCNDGLLDMVLVDSQNVFGRLGVILNFLLRRKQREQWVHYEQVSEVKLHTNRPVAIQVDGDPDGYTNRQGFPATVIRVVPAALHVIVPAQQTELFS